ncbi:MAG: hypothetical protein JNK57_10215 [Planctomycetaceae bacterium]|nr:hypothetical protein [Planctomycetaceae bacterium]
MWHRILGVNVLGLCLFSLIGCGGDAPKASEPKATPTSSSSPAPSSEAPTQETKSDEAPAPAPTTRTRMPAVAGSGGGQPAAKSDAPASGRRRAPAVAGSGGDGGAAAAAAASSEPATNNGGAAEPAAGGGGTSQSMTIDEGSSGSGGSAHNTSSSPPSSSSDTRISFEKTIAPMISQKCGNCHVREAKGDTSLATATEIIKLVTAGDSSNSQLFTVVNDNSMPPKNPLSDEDKGTLKKWIDEGAQLDPGQTEFDLRTLAQQGGSGQSGPPSGYNNLPPGYGGGQGGPPQQSGPPPGYNNLPPGYGGQGGPPQQSGPPPGYNNRPPGYGDGQGGPPQQSGPPAGFNSPPPGYGSGQQQGGGSGSAAMTLDEGGGPAAPPQNAGNFGQPQNTPPPAQLAEKSFWDMATNAYAAGRDADAYQYLLAEFAANRARFDEMPLSFSAQDKSTTIGVRLGIGVFYSAQEGVSGKPPVIGDPAPVVQRGNQRGGRGPSSFGGSSPPTSGPPAGGMPGMGNSVPRDARGMLTYYGGDLASALLEELEQKFKREPAYGMLWPRMPAKVMLPSDVANSGQSQVSTGGGGSSRRRGPMMSGSGGDGGPPVSGFGAQASGPPEGLFPGLTFLGEGNPADLARKAKNEGLDGLILIEHRASVVRSTGATTSQTTVKFYTPADGKEKAATAQLGYAAVANQVKEGKDPIGKELKSLFTKIDRLVAVAEMPALTEELAKSRLESILGDSKSEPLRFVNEVNYYLQKGWLNEDDAQKFVINVLGEPAALELLSGDFEKQKAALGRWLPAK